MSYAAIKWTYMSPHVLGAKLNPSELAVLRAICWFYTDKGRTEYDQNCPVSVERLAETIGKSTDVVDRAKAVLRKKGLIRWDRAANFDENDRKANNYHIDCPEVAKILRRNLEKRKANQPPDEEALYKDHPLQPGAWYDRPDPKMLATAFPTPLTQPEAEWMADALSFVCDRPENRQALHDALRKSSGIGKCRAALERCRATSQNGRVIRNRLKYLLAALRKER